MIVCSPPSEPKGSTRRVTLAATGEPVTRSSAFNLQSGDLVFVAGRAWVVDEAGEIHPEGES